MNPRHLYSEYKFFSSLLGHKIYLILLFSFLASVIETFGLILFIPDILNISFNNPVDPNTPLRTVLNFFEINYENNFIELLTLLVFFYISKAFFLFYAYFYIGSSRASLLAKIRLFLYKSLRETSFTDFIKEERSNIVSRLKEQSTETVVAFTCFIQTSNSLLNVIVYFMGAILLSPFLGTLGLITGVIILILFKRLNENLRIYSRRNVKYHANFTKYILQFINAFKYLKSTNQEEKFVKRSNTLIGDSQKIENIYAKYNAIIASSKEPIAFLIFLFLFFFGFLNDMASGLSFGVLMLFYKASNNVVILQSQIQQYLQLNGSLNNIIREFKKTKKLRNKFNSNNQNTKFKYISFENVTYKYPNTTKQIVIPNFRLTYPGLYVIKGPSGSGKSTLFNLLSKNLPPSSGNIFIDSEELSKINENYWRSNIGYVPQNQVIFDGTFAQNISMKFDGNITNDDIKKIRDVAADVDIDSLIQSLPNGYDTLIGDYSFEISGGQIQRLMLARELYRSSKILILDEPTSALDKLSKLKIIKVLENIQSKSLVIIVTHNPEDFSSQKLTIELKDSNDN